MLHAYSDKFSFIYQLFKGRNYDFLEHSEKLLWSDSEKDNHHISIKESLL